MSLNKFLNYFFNSRLKKIILFNKKIFKNIDVKKDGIILCEISNNSSNQISFSHLLNLLKEKYECKAVAYQNNYDQSLYQRIKFFLQKKLNYKVFSIYRSFNIDDFVLTINTKNQNLLSKNKHQQILKDIKRKKDVLKIEIEGINIGDLIYDSYLKRCSKPTIDIESEDFSKILLLSLQNFYFWKLFFEKNIVNSIIVSHNCYIESLVVRVAAKKNIETFLCNWDNIHRIDQKNLYPYSKYKFYRNDFRDLTAEQKKRGLNLAKQSIEKRFNDSDKSEDRVMFYSEKFSFHNQYSSATVLKKNKKKKILIAMHCFLDAPHGYDYFENNIFNDFFEWLIYLYDLSKKTNFDWYIKNHPSSIAKTDEILFKFLKDRTEFNLLSSNISHDQLIKEGIDCVLTVHGTIGWEYAYHQIPVINASINNPHRLYDFNLHARNLKEYEKMILNFNRYEINFDKKNIYEYFLVHNMLLRDTWLFDDYLKVIKEIGGYKNLGKLIFYDYWIEKFNYKLHNNICSKLRKFLSSSDLYMKNYEVLT
ncbi:hypothetical protein OAL74_02095 [Candidatus Pelagibacter sp.]|nr:hypothetical protein [Candidatus Pelagibacter sp.]